MFRAVPAALAAASVLAVGLAGCDRAPPALETTAEAPATPAAPPAAAPAAAPASHPLSEAVLEADGLTPANPNGGTARKLTFGEGEDAVIAFLTGLNGGTAPIRTANAECPAGPMHFADWGGGLTLDFQDGRFAGWSLGTEAGAGLATLENVRVGSTLAELRAARPDVRIEETSLGREFTAGGISGLLSGPGETAHVESLWAGTICAFR